VLARPTIFPTKTNSYVRSVAIHSVQRTPYSSITPTRSHEYISSLRGAYRVLCVRLITLLVSFVLRFSTLMQSVDTIFNHGFRLNDRWKPRELYSNNISTFFLCNIVSIFTRQNIMRLSDLTTA